MYSEVWGAVPELVSTVSGVTRTPALAVDISEVLCDLVSCRRTCLLASRRQALGREP
jgi:hypothetical protein